MKVSTGSKAISYLLQARQSARQSTCILQRNPCVHKNTVTPIKFLPLPPSRGHGTDYHASILSKSETWHDSHFIKSHFYLETEDIGDNKGNCHTQVCQPLVNRCLTMHILTSANIISKCVCMNLRSFRTMISVLCCLVLSHKLMIQRILYRNGRDCVLLLLYSWLLSL